MSANTYLINKLTAHQIDIQMYSTSERHALIKELDKVLDVALEMLDNASTEYQQSRAEDIAQSLRLALADHYENLSSNLTQKFKAFAKQELSYNRGVLNEATVENYDVSLPDYAVLADAALDAPITLNSKQHNIRSMLSGYTRDQVNAVINHIRIANSLGYTNEQAKDYLLQNRPSLVKEANTLVRTVNNHISSTARKQVMDANREVLRGFRVVATLDSRTTFICASKDQQIFDLDEPRPPYHYNCRSVASPVLKDEYQASLPGLTTRAARIDGKTQHVSAYKTFEGFLKDQTAQEQRHYLGATRYKLWKQGKLKIEKFVDSDDTILTLDQLRARNPEIFNELEI